MVLSLSLRQRYFSTTLVDNFKETKCNDAM